jgi:hypothetical protein
MTNGGAPAIDIMNTVFPVVAMKEDQGAEGARPDSFGTAFCVSPGVFITAAHVVHEASEVGPVALVGSVAPDQPFGVARATHIEIFDAVDVAVLFAEPQVTLLNVLLGTRLQALSDVASFGYPHSFTYLPDDPRHPRVDVVFRAYKGHTITTRAFERLSAQPAIYEVSCPFPPGMSGAPLLYQHRAQLALAGLVIGCPKVHYRGLTQRVGAALVVDELATLHIQKTDCRVCDLPGIAVGVLSYGVDTEAQDAPTGP